MEGQLVDVWKFYCRTTKLDGRPLTICNLLTKLSKFVTHTAPQPCESAPAYTLFSRLVIIVELVNVQAGLTPVLLCRLLANESAIASIYLTLAKARNDDSIAWYLAIHQLNRFHRFPTAVSPHEPCQSRREEGKRSSKKKIKTIYGTHTFRDCVQSGIREHCASLAVPVIGV